MKKALSNVIIAGQKIIYRPALIVIFLAVAMHASGASDAEILAPVTYSVDLDVCHAAISNEGTGNKITVVFQDREGKFLAKDTKLNVEENCWGADATFKAEIRIRPSKIKIITSGEDGLFIDEISCYARYPLVKNEGFKDVENPSRTLLGHHGIDNGKGWCLSTDPNDAFGEWKGSCENGCRSSQTFWFKTNVNGNSSAGREDKYVVRIDNCHSDIGNEGTGNKITVEFLSGNTVIDTRSQNGVPSNCFTVDAIFSTRSSKNITAVRVSTNGNDGYYIDELRLFKNDKLQKQHGGDNGGGWCLSTDPGDAHGEWKGKCSGTGNSCGTSVTFPYR